MHEFWYDHIKPKYEEKTQLCYVNTDSFIILIKTRCLWRHPKIWENKFDTSNYKVKRSLLRGKHKKLFGY